METISASVVKIEDKFLLMIHPDGLAISIPMSEDKPSEVKMSFNRLITRMKDGDFKIELKDVGEDLFSQVAKEYTTQLNREIQEVHGEMQQLGLVAE